MKFMVYKGKKYIVKKMTHAKGDDKLYLAPFDEEKYDKIVGEIAEKCEEAIDLKALLKQSLSSLEFDEVKKILKALKRGAKPKAKDGCYEIKVGKEYIPIC